MTPAQTSVADLLNQGVISHQRGELAQAQALYAQILAIEPQNFDALHLLGVIANQSHHPDVAVILIGQAIAIDPNDAASHSNLGLALQSLNRLEDAVASYDRAIALRANYAEAFSNRGNALEQLNRHQEALESYDRAIAIQPNYAQAHYNRGNALKGLKRYQEAVDSYDRAIAIQPRYIKAYTNRGRVLEQLNRYQEALESYDQAIAMKSDDADIYYNRANLLKDPQQALDSYNKAIAIEPEHAKAYANRGNALRDLMHHQDALASYDKAINFQPECAENYWNKSLLLLLCGDFEKAWPLYESRWSVASLGLGVRDFSQPLWLGGENLAGKTILLYAEQGLGDTIQFCRYALLVKALGARVVLQVPSALRGLLANLPEVDVLLETGQALPEFDYHCPLMSLPLAFRTTLSNIPNSTAYLQSNPLKREAWRQRLGAHTKPRVGLVWRGSSMHNNDHNRSLSLSELLPYLPDGLTYVSLQQEVRESDQQALANSPLLHFGNELKDFTDTAALCDCMDVVVSVDTSVAHLAAAMGKPTWVLLPYVPDWRWLLDREDSPWYASVKLYRQGQDRQWATVLNRVAQALLSLPQPLS